MIRRIGINDIEIINKLGSKYDPDFVKKYNLKSYIDKSIYLLHCYDKGAIEGFIIATKVQETIEILLLYVDENYRRQKVASKLINSLEHYSDIENIFLEVSVENEAAIRLYTKLNFEIINVRKKYYNGIDAYIMKKKL